MFSEQLLGLPVQLTVPIEPRVPCAGGVMTVKARASPSGSEPVRVITRGVSSFGDTVLESAVGAWLFWIVTVVVAEPVLVAESVKQMRIVLAPTLRSLPLIVTFVVFGDVEYVPELSCVPSEQFVPPLRTLYVPFSVACQVIVAPPFVSTANGELESVPPLPVSESIVTVGGVVSLFPTVVEAVAVLSLRSASSSPLSIVTVFVSVPLADPRSVPPKVNAPLAPGATFAMFQTSVPPPGVWLSMNVQPPRQLPVL